MVVLLGAGVGSQVLSSGSLDISGLHWDHGSVWVSHQASVVGPVGGVGSDGVDGSSGSGVGNLGGVNLSGVDWHNSSVSVTDQSPGDSDSVGVVGSVGVAGSVGNGASSLSVGQAGGGNLGGLRGDHGTVGVGHQLGRAHSDGGGENQKLHDESWVWRAAATS